MTIVRWDPYRDFGLTTSGTWVPPVDIYQNGDHEVVLKAELPDMTREDIDITVDNFTLTIKGEKKFASDVKEEQFHRIERRYGAFSRSFSLPQTVDAEQGLGRVQERRAHRAAPAARGSQAAADQGRRRRVTTAQAGTRPVGQAEGQRRSEPSRMPAHPACPDLASPSSLRATL